VRNEALQDRCHLTISVPIQILDSVLFSRLLYDPDALQVELAPMGGMIWLSGRALRYAIVSGCRVRTNFRCTSGLFAGSLERKRNTSPKMAEGEGFEPPEPFGSPVFKTGALNHSATLPYSCTAFYSECM